MPKIPDYTQQVQPDLLRVPETPQLNLSGGLSAVKQIGDANIGLAQTTQKLAGVLADHAVKQYESQQEQIAAKVYTQYSRDAQDRLFSNEQVTEPEIVATSFKVGEKPSYIKPSKPVYTDVTRFKGEKLNELGNAAGGFERTNNWFFSNRDNYINQVQSPTVKAKLASMIDNHFTNVRGSVLDHEVSQLQKNDQNIKDAAVKQGIADAYGFQTPEALKTIITNVGIASDDFARSKQLDAGQAMLLNQKNKADAVENSVIGKLTTSGDINQSYALLDSVKDGLSPENYDAIKTKIEKAGVQLKEQQVHADNVALTQGRFEALQGFVSGKYNIANSSEFIRQLGVTDPKGAAALKLAVESKGDYTPSEENDVAYAEVANDIATASSPKEMSNFLVNALKEQANGNISKENLASLFNASIKRSQGFNADGTLKPDQVAVDKGYSSVYDWYKKYGNSDVTILNAYMKNIEDGQSPVEAYDKALYTAQVKKNPNRAIYKEKQVVYNPKGYAGVVIGFDSDGEPIVELKK